MGITNGYVDWAIRDDRTPRDKTYPDNRNKRYVVCHSIEGFLHGQLVPPRFLSTAKDPDGSYTEAASASCIFILLIDGRLVQCFPWWASTWTSGSAKANQDGIPIEAEGVAGTPLNAAQCATFVRLMRELGPEVGIVFTRTDAKGTIREHRELSATACPSGRYAPAYAALAVADTIPQEEADVSVTEYEDLLLAVFSGSEERELPREDRLENARHRVKLRVDLQAQSVAEVAEGARLIAAGIPANGKVPAHTHTPGEVTQ